MEDHTWEPKLPHKGNGVPTAKFRVQRDGTLQPVLTRTGTTNSSSQPRPGNQSYMKWGFKTISSGFETCFVPSTQLSPVPDANHISDHDCWRHFETPKPRDGVMCD